MWWVWGSPISIWKKCPFELLVDLIICNKYVIANVLRFLTSMKDWSFHGSAIIFLKPLLGYQVGPKPEAVVYFGFVRIFLDLGGGGGECKILMNTNHKLLAMGRGGVRNPSAMNVAQLTVTKFKTPPKNEKQKSRAFVVTGFLRTAINILQTEHCS